MSKFELAQLNVAQMTVPLDSPALEEFVNNLDRVNQLAEQSPGYIWRLQTEEGDATELRPFGEDMLVNLSVWESIEALYNYVYKSPHVEIMRRRKEWFEKINDAYTVLWWIPKGHKPTIEEAKVKLKLLQDSGPSQEAFTFKNSYPNPSVSKQASQAD